MDICFPSVGVIEIRPVYKVTFFLVRSPPPPHVFPFASHRMSRCKFEALHPLHRTSPQAHGSSEHKHVSGQGKYLARWITDAESCEVYLELQVWKGHIIVHQSFSEVKDSIRKISFYLSTFFPSTLPPLHLHFTFHSFPSTPRKTHSTIWYENRFLKGVNTVSLRQIHKQCIMSPNTLK